MHRSPMVLLVLCGLIAGCAGLSAWREEEDAVVAGPADDVRPLPVGGGFSATGCPFEVEIDLQIDCGELEVPESRTGLSDASITLPVAVLRTPAAEPAPDPVVYLQGGPGGVSLAEHWWWLSDTDVWQEHPILATRDLVLFDQRGTGYAQPSLNCDEDEEPDACHDRLVDEGVTVAAYSTPENVADLADLRAALGYEQWNLFGSSYGTRVGLAALRDHPTGIRTLVLDGVYPPDATPAYERFVPVALGAIDALADACAAQPACADAYGDVRRLLADSADAIEAAPTEGIDGWGLVDLVLAALYDLDRVDDIPLALARADAGDVAGAVALLAGEDSELPRPARPPARGASGVVRQIGDPAADSAGFFHAVECREEHPFTDVGAVEAELDPLVDRYGRTVIESLFASVYQGPELVCPAWEVGVAAAEEREPATGSAPALLFAGGFDPVTPRAFAELAAASLDSATVVWSPHLSHQSVLAHPCIDAIVAGFLADPTAASDTSCAARIAPPVFAVP